MGKGLKTYSILTAIMFATVLSNVAAAADGGRVTFTKDVLPILQENCQECHRASGANFSGMVAPMALTTFQEVRPWAKAIVKQVTAKTMPPWFASPEHHGQFELERQVTSRLPSTLRILLEAAADNLPETLWDQGPAV